MIIGSASAMEVDDSTDLADDSINVTQSDELKVVDDVSPSSNQVNELDDSSNSLDDTSYDTQLADELDEDVVVTADGGDGAVNAKDPNGLLGASDEDVLRAGNTYYVSLNGRDNRNAGTLNDPFRTLSYAISRATNGDTIYIRGGTYTDAVSYGIFGSDGNIMVEITKELTIQAYNDEEVILDANYRHRIFTVYSDNVVISGITFTHGNQIDSRYQYNYGSAIYSFDHEGLRVENCKFIDNRAEYGAFNVDQFAHCDVVNCYFSGNTATAAAAALCYWIGSDLNIENCTFEDNSAPYGGAVLWRESSGYALNCTFNNNTATGTGGYDGGGAIDVYANGVSVINCEFNDNQANHFGGAVYLTGDNNQITGSEFNGNSANYGSAIYNSGELTVSNSEMFNNKANSQALTVNVVVNDNNVTVTTNLTGRDNIANAIYNAGTIELTNVDYYGAEGNMNTGSTPITPGTTPSSTSIYQDTREAGIDIVIDIYNSENQVVKTYTAKSNIYGGISFNFDDLDAGVYRAVAYHVEDTYYSGITNSQTFTINSYKTNTTLDVNDSSIYIGDSVNITAIVKHGDTNLTVGDVEIYDGETLITTVTAGGSFIYTPDTVGTHNLTARYLGSGNYAPSESDIVAVEVNKIDVNVLIYIENVTYPAAPVAIINASAPGTYEVYINGRPYSITFNEGETSKTVTGITLPVGEGYEANVTFNETEKYNYASNSTTFNVVNGTITATVSVEDVIYPNQAVATVTSDVDGEYNVTIAGKTYTVTVTDGTGTTNIDKLDVGEYTAELSAKIPNYNPVSGSDSFKVQNGTITATVSVEDVIYPNQAVATVTSDVDGEYNVTIAGKTYTVTVTDGTGTTNIDKLDVGEYTAELSAKIPNYNPVSGSDSFKVQNGTITATVSVEDVIYPNQAVATVTSDVDGEYNVTIAGKTYTVTVTDGTGTTNIDKLDVGEYTAELSAKIPNYNPVSGSDSFKVQNGTITATVSVEDVIYPNQAVATVTSDVDGEYNVTIAGKTYTVTVTDGTGTTNIDKLDVGEYTAELSAKIPNYNPVSGSDSFKVQNGTITATVSVEDVIYPNQAVATVTSDVDGEYNVTIAGKTYTVTVTDGTGTTNIDKLDVGEYTAELSAKIPNYNPVSGSDSFKVQNGTITATVSVEDVIYPNQAVATVTSDVDGEYNVTIAGKTYTVTVTDGTGTTNIDKLDVGEYTAELSAKIPNYNPVSGSDSFKVQNGTITATVSVEDVIYPNQAVATVTSDVDGEYNVTIAGKTYTVTVTDGTGTTNIDKLDVGEYTAELSAKIPNYNPVSGSDSFKVQNGTITATVSVEDVIYPNQAVATVTSDVDGEYNVTIAGKTYTVTVTDGTGTTNIDKLDVGEYTAELSAKIPNYNPVSGSDSFKVQNGTITATVSVEDVIYPNQAVATVTSDVDGEYNVTIAGKTYTVTVTDGTGTTNIDKLDVGEYTAELSAKIPNYNPVSGSDSFKVQNGTITATVSVEDVIYPNQAVATVTSDVDGEYNVTIAGKTYTVTVTDGTGTTNIDKLDVGEYTAELSAKIPNYNPVSGSDSFKVQNGTITATVSVEDVIYPNQAVATVTSDVDGEYNVTIAGKTYTVTVTDGTGTTNIDKLDVGEYTAELSAKIPNYNPVSGSDSFKVQNGTITATVSVEDVIYPNQAVATVTSDVDGEYNVTIAGKTYTVTVTDGTGTTNIDKLDVGEYTAELSAKIPNYNPVSGSDSFKVQNGTITATVSVEDVIYPNQAVATVTSDVDGEYNVTIAGKTYTVTVTDGTGTTNIDKLDVGEYTAELSAKIPNYNPVSGSDSFKVQNGTITATVSVEDVIYPNQAVATVTSDVDGEYNVTIAGKTYTVTVTDGTGTTNIDKLDVGEYTAELSAKIPNYNPVSGSDSFKVQNGTITATVSVEDVIYPNQAVATVTSDVDGEYNVTIAGKTYTVTVTDGTGTTNIDKLDVGEYTAELSAKIPNYNPVSGSDSFKVQNGTITATVSVEDVIYPNQAVATVTSDVDGEYNVTIAGKTYTVTVTDGTGTTNIDKLDVGEYTAELSAKIPNYNPVSGSDSFKVQNGTITATVSVEDVIYPNQAVATVTSDVDGEYNVTIAGKTYTVTVTDGTGTTNIDKLDVGEYTAELSAKIPNYNPVSGSDSFKVQNGTITATVSVEDVIYPNQAVATVTSDVDGEYNVTIAGKTYTVTVTDGTGTTNIDKLDVGEYTAELSAKIPNYNPVSGSDSFKVQNGTITATVSVEDVIYPNQAVATVTSDVDGEYNVTIAGKTYTVTVTDGTGTTNIDKLDVDEYTAELSAKIPNYNPVSGSDSFKVQNGTITATVSVEDVIYPNQAVATVTSDVDGEYNVTIAGKTYTVTVTDGTGTTNIDKLDVDEYTAELSAKIPNYNPVSGSDSFKVQNGTITATVSVEDVIYPNQAVATVTSDVDGEYNVTIAGKTYTVTVTDGTGTTNIDKLDVDEYTAELSAKIPNYNPVSGSDSFKVQNGTITATVSVEDVIYPNQAVATVTSDVDGEYNVTIAGKTYTVTVTDGTGTTNIDKLDVDEYTAELSAKIPNYNPVSGSDSFKVQNGTITATVSVEDVIYPNQAVATVTSDVDGEYNVTIAGKTYTVTVTDGTGTTNIDKLDVGEYTAELSAKIPNYNPVSGSDSFEIIEGVITLHIVVDDVTYPNHPIAHVTADVDGEYYIVITPIDLSGSKLSASSIVNVLTANSQIIPVTVSGGSADVDLGLLKAGEYTATAEGDVPNYKVVSDTDPFEVKKADPQLNASSSPDNPVYNKDDVTVSHELPSDAIGTVTYIVDGGKPVTKGVNESFTFTPDKAGKHTVTVIYSGDDNYLPSNVTLTVNVAKADSPMDISSDESKPKAGDKVKMPVSLPDDATGTVTYYVNGKKVAVLPVGETFEFNPKEPGQYNITASYSGDDNYKANTTSIVIEVAKNPNNNSNGTPAKNTAHDVDVLPAAGNPIALLVLAILILLGSRRRKEN